MKSSPAEKENYVSEKLKHLIELIIIKINKMGVLNCVLEMSIGRGRQSRNLSHG